LPVRASNEAESGGARCAEPRKAALLRWSLADWIELARASGAAALFKRQADWHSLAALWQQFKAPLAARPDEIAELLRIWVNFRGAGGGWASMTPSDAREWVERLRVLIPRIAIEAFRAWKGDGRRNVKSPVALLGDANDIKEGGRALLPSLRRLAAQAQSSRHRKRVQALPFAAIDHLVRGCARRAGQNHVGGEICAVEVRGKSHGHMHGRITVPGGDDATREICHGQVGVVLVAFMVLLPSPKTTTGPRLKSRGKVNRFSDSTHFDF
jgi:hypothetical protein